MGLNDAQEMLDAAKEHVLELEAEIRDLREENERLRRLITDNHKAYMDQVTR